MALLTDVDTRLLQLLLLLYGASCCCLLTVMVLHLLGILQCWHQ
jgi:hypothetical protein